MPQTIRQTKNLICHPKVFVLLRNILSSEAVNFQPLINEENKDIFIHCHWDICEGLLST